MDTLQLLTRRDILLPVGVCLVIAGFVMRGIARSATRAQAYRKQHDLHPAASDDPALRPAPDAIDRHLEKFLPRYATATIWVGTILSIIAFFR